MPEPYAHYEEFPYPDAASMVQRAPLREWRTENGPRKDNWEQWFPGETYGQERKRVLVVGCGTTEAVIVAQQEPMIDVVGIDPSDASIKIARANADGVENLSLHCFSLKDFAYDAPGLFDGIICSGVLHHVPMVVNFVRELRRRIKSGHPLSVMVYGDKQRGFVIDFATMLRALNVEPNAEGIAFTRHLLNKLRFDHPARKFTAQTDNTDAQIADLWLHRYFRQFSAPSLFHLMELGGFRYRRWMNSEVVSTRVIEELPERFDAFKQTFRGLELGLQLEIGQILNHADAKLTVMFEAA